MNAIQYMQCIISRCGVQVPRFVVGVMSISGAKRLFHLWSWTLGTLFNLARVPMGRDSLDLRDELILHLVPRGRPAKAIATDVK